MPSPAPCPTPQGCPNPEPCSEVMDAQCVIYTGENIICDTDVVVTTNDTVAEALENIVDYLCDINLQLVLENPLQCAEQPIGFISPAGVTLNEALENIVDYFCGGEPASITLTSAGGTETLVNDGTGPTLATKGLTAGNDITLTPSATDIIITNTSPNVDQNLWATIAATTGSTTANTTTDTLTIVGASGITTSITGDTLTITGSGVVQKYNTSLSPLGILPNTITHSLSTGFVIVSFCVNGGTGQLLIPGVDYTYVVGTSNSITVTPISATMQTVSTNVTIMG